MSFSNININNVSWPSLYNPMIELSRSKLNAPVQPGGSYLQQPDDIFRFTLYWTLIFHLPSYILAGLYAFFNFLFPPTRPTNNSFTLLPASPPASRNLSPLARTPSQEWTKPPRVNARRSRLMFAFLVLLTFLGMSLISAVMGSAVVGFVLAGVYRAGGFYMSTWVPFVWAVIQGLIALLGIWPSIIDII